MDPSAALTAFLPRNRGRRSRCRLAIASYLRHVDANGQASPSPQIATLPKSSEEIERCVIASFRVAESMGFEGEYRQWDR